MVTLQEIEGQLKRIGTSFHFWGRAEMMELVNVLIPGEQIQSCMNGRWEGGFALLCATDQRLLLIDRKPMFLNMEDIRYDMIFEVDFSHRLLNATVRICTPNKTLAFMAFNHTKLRHLTNYVQQRVMELRQQQMFVQTSPQPPAQQPIQPQPVVNDAQITTQQPDDNTSFTTFPEYPSGLYQRFPSSNPYTNSPLIMRRRVTGFRR